MLSQDESVQRMRLGGAGCPDESPEDDPQVEAAIEQVLHLREVAVSVFAVAEGVVRAGEGRLQIAQYGVDGQECWVLDAGRTAAGDVGLMKDARTLHGLEATQPVGDQRGRREQRLGGKGVNRLLGEGPLRQADPLRRAGLGGRTCSRGTRPAIRGGRWPVASLRCNLN